LNKFHNAFLSTNLTEVYDINKTNEKDSNSFHNIYADALNKVCPIREIKVNSHKGETRIGFLTTLVNYGREVKR
jgi:hypothetical protein